MDFNHVLLFEQLKEYNLETLWHNIFHSRNSLDVARFAPLAEENLLQIIKERGLKNRFKADRIYELGTSDEGRTYYKDCESGLLFFKSENDYHICYDDYYSSQADIRECAAIRRILLERTKHINTVFSPRTKHPQDGFLCPPTLRELFAHPIPEYFAESKEELEKITKEIEDAVQPIPYFEKIWYRGQTKEYCPLRMSNETADELGVRQFVASIPSLTPSIARVLTTENHHEIISQFEKWVRGLNTWKLSQATRYQDYFYRGSPSYGQLVNASLDTNITAFPDFIRHYDGPGADSIEEYFLNTHSGNDKPISLTVQQYGGYSAMLDITDDLDTALFFSQSALDRKTMRYKLVDPTPENIIYVFVQPKSSSSFSLGHEIYGGASVEDNLNLPLRLSRQHCGLLTGATIFARNTYGYRVIAKIHLNNTSIRTSKTVEEMFPSTEEDSLYQVLTDYSSVLPGLYG